MSDHDDVRSEDDDLDPAELALAARLTTALTGQAGTVVLAEEPFDPARPGTHDGQHDAARAGRAPDGEAGAGQSVPTAGPGRTPGRRGAGGDAAPTPASLDALPITPADPARRGWIVWVAGAAAAAVLVAAMVMINAVRQPTVDVGTAPAPLLVGPGIAWAPTWVPDGLELWDLQVRPVPDWQEGADTPNDVPSVTQLIEAGGTRLLVLIGGSSSLLEAEPDGVTHVPVRGISGVQLPLAAFTSGSPDGVELDWEESGLVFAARAVEAEPGAAVALLDRLDLADPADPGAGFRAPADGSVTVLTDDVRDEPYEPATSAQFGYSAGRPTSDELTLSVSTEGPSSGWSPLSHGSPYLTAAFDGEIGPDGMVFAFRPGTRGPGLSVALPGATAYWPDGRSVLVSGPDLDRATAEQVVAGVEEVTFDDLAPQLAAVNERLGSGPVLARADLPSATLEVVGEPGPVALCLTVDAQRRCWLSDRLAGMGGSNPAPGQMAFGSELIDGRWFVFGANEGPVDVTVELGGGGSGVTTGTGPPDPSVRPESATIGPWTLALLVVPDGWERAEIAFPDRSMGLGRPAS